MSIICSICGKKQSGFFEDYPLSTAHKDTRICGACQDMLQVIKYSDQAENIESAVEYFGGVLSQGANPEAIKIVTSAIYKCTGKVLEVKQIPVMLTPEKVEKPVERAPQTYDLGIKSFENLKDKESMKFNLDNLYTDIGKKIKSWAKWIFVIEAICALIGAISLMLSGEEDLLLLGILLLIMGPVVAFVSTWILYGFGELVDKACTKEQQDAQYYAFMSENLKAMRENSDKMLELLQKLNYK